MSDKPKYGQCEHGAWTNVPCPICPAASELPAPDGSAIREAIARIIMDQFWGELPSGYDWKTEASTLGVTVSDTDKGRETVLDLTDKIITALPNDGTQRGRDAWATNATETQSRPSLK